MNNISHTGLWRLDRFTLIWLALVGILVVASLATMLFKDGRGADTLTPAYTMGDTVEDFVYNAYVAHMLGDLSRLQSMYDPEVWAGMMHEDKDWRESYFLDNSNLLGFRILDTVEYSDGRMQARIAFYISGQNAPLNIQSLDVSTNDVRLSPTAAGDGWQLLQQLPRYWH